MRTTALILSAFILAGCASAPSQQELNTRLAGLSKVELLACMGAPNGAARDDDTEVLTYAHRDFHMGMTYQCDANVVLKAGRVARITVTGDAPGTIDVTSKVCRAKLDKCAP